jgi:outer membrane receptor for ferrienterochelin and colicins
VSRRPHLLFLALLVPGSAAAQADPARAPSPSDSSPEGSGHELAVEDIVVTATRTETELDESPVRVDVVTRAQVEASGARDVGEILEESPGIVVTRSFRGDSIQLGGLDPEYTLILVDGDRAPGRIGGGVDLGRYTLENVERIEVLRGPGSALYGSDAIGGVVNILTRRATRPLELEGSAQAGWGEGAIADLGVMGGFVEGPVAARVTAGYHASEAFRRGPSTSTSGSAREQWEAGARARVEVDDVELDARADYVVRRLAGVDENASGAVFDRVQLGEQLQVGLGARYRPAPRTTFSARASYSLFREQFLNDQRGSQALDDVQDNREHLGQLTLQLDHGVGDHRITVGYEHLAQLLESDRLATHGRRTRVAPFVQDDWTVLDDDVRLVLIAGARFDADSQFGTALSPRVGVRLDPAPQLVLRASYGMGFRAPSFQELLLRFENPSVGYVVNGNPALGPERSHGVDVSLEWTPWRELVLSAAYYRNDLEGMIATVTVSDDPVNGTLFSYANLARAYAQGLEARVAATPVAWLRLLAGYAFLDTRDEAADRPLENRPAHRVTASANIDHRESGLGANARFALSVDRVVFVDDDGDGVESRQTLAPLAQLDLRVSWAFLEQLAPDRSAHQDLEVSAGVDNVLDGGDAFLVLRPRTYWLALRGRY